MSSYLLFFAVGDFERLTNKADGTEHGIMTRKGALSQAAFALESSVQILREFNHYFGIPYPLPKLDNIAAPGSSQFFGAMENWGAILTFEQYLLLDPAISTQADKQGAFATQAHEMTHQWFGNLATMRWWDDCGSTKASRPGSATAPPRACIPNGTQRWRRSTRARPRCGWMR